MSAPRSRLRGPVQRSAGVSGRISLPGITVHPGLADAWTLVVPLAAVYLFTVIGSALSASAQVDLGYALVNLVIVVGLSTFVGNSGVLSFGHLAFTAVGAYVFALLATPVATKENLLSDLPDVLTRIHVPSFPAMIALPGFAPRASIRMVVRPPSE